MTELRPELAGFRDALAPWVHRLRYLADGGDPAEIGVVEENHEDEEWRGRKAEVKDVDEKLLDSARKELKAAGAGEIAKQIKLTGSDDPGELALELDSLLAVIEVWRYEPLVEAREAEEREAEEPTTG